MSVAAEFPVGVPSDGMVKAVFAPTIVDTEGVTVAEWTAGTAVDTTCYITALEVSGDAQTIEDWRLCSKQVFEDYATVTRTLSITYVYDPQNPGGTDNELYEALTEGTKGFFGLFWGKDADEAVAGGDVADVYTIKAGPQFKNAPERNSKLTVTQKLYVTGPTAIDSVVAA